MLCTRAGEEGEGPRVRGDPLQRAGPQRQGRQGHQQRHQREFKIRYLHKNADNLYANLSYLRANKIKRWNLRQTTIMWLINFVMRY